MIVNAHTHIYSALAGERFGVEPVQAAPRDGYAFASATFGAALRQLWWRLDLALDERSLRAAARLYVAEAKLAGTDVLVDHHESPRMIGGSLDIIADACEEMGMAALLCYGATERNHGATEALQGLEECRRFILNNRRPLVRGAVGLHAAFTVSDATIRVAGNLCRDLGVPLHVHVAEDEVDRVGFARLMKNEALTKGSILAHGVHLDEDDVRVADYIGCWFVQNPRSNRVNGVGYATALRVSSRVALGTDGFPSRISDEAEEIRALESPRVVADRLAAGARLAREAGLPGGRPATFDIEAIRAEAAEEARRLREKMHEHSATGAGR